MSRCRTEAIIRTQYTDIVYNSTTDDDWRQHKSDAYRLRHNRRVFWSYNPLFGSLWGRYIISEWYIISAWHTQHTITFVDCVLNMYITLFRNSVDSLTALARTRMDIPTARASQNQPTHLEGPFVSVPITNPKFSIVWQCKSRSTKPQHASTTLIRRRDWRSVMISPFLSPARVRCWSSWSGRGFGKRWS